MLTGGKEPIVVRIFGADLAVLRAKAAEIEKIMAGVDGLEDEHIDISTDVPQIQVEVDLAKAAAVRPQARRRAPGRRHPGGGRGGRRHLP